MGWRKEERIRKCVAGFEVHGDRMAATRRLDSRSRHQLHRAGAARLFPFRDAVSWMLSLPASMYGVSCGGTATCSSGSSFRS